MPDASGRFRGIAVPSIPWHERDRMREEMLRPAPAITPCREEDCLEVARLNGLGYCPLHD